MREEFLTAAAYAHDADATVRQMVHARLTAYRLALERRLPSRAQCGDVDYDEADVNRVHHDYSRLFVLAVQGRVVDAKRLLMGDESQFAAEYRTPGSRIWSRFLYGSSLRPDIDLNAPFFMFVVSDPKERELFQQVRGIYGTVQRDGTREQLWTESDRLKPGVPSWWFGATALHIAVAVAAQEWADDMLHVSPGEADSRECDPVNNGFEFAKLLLQLGADPNVLDGKCRSPLDVVGQVVEHDEYVAGDGFCKMGYCRKPRVYELLRQYGAVWMERSPSSAHRAPDAEKHVGTRSREHGGLPQNYERWFADPRPAIQDVDFVEGRQFVRRPASGRITMLDGHGFQLADGRNFDNTAGAVVDDLDISPYATDDAEDDIDAVQVPQPKGVGAGSAQGMAVHCVDESAERVTGSRRMAEGSPLRDGLHSTPAQERRRVAVPVDSDSATAPAGSLSGAFVAAMALVGEGAGPGKTA